MKTWYLLVIICLVCSVQNTLSEKCNREATKIECSATEYQNYVDCVRSRMKRSADCYDDEEEDCSSNQCGNSCDNCDCNECTSSNCGNSCNKKCCNSCCEFRECSTNHCCHKVCHNSCRTSSCRSSCRRSCYKSVRRDRTEPKESAIYVSGESSDSTYSNSSNRVHNRGTHNITTVIHLNNLINNTNLIDVPINLNNSNVNNITVENSQNGSSTYGSSSTSNQCCSVIEPRQCVRTNTYPFINCFHYRRQQCGEFCRAPVVHKVAQNVCYNTQTQNPTCGQQIIYVPQPRQSCSYQPQWPYVTCTNQGGSCNGCYDYLLNPYRTQSSCGSSCYNYGMTQGAVYRQGPVLSPGYSLPLPPVNPVIPPGCTGYGGCGLSSMGSFINPGMYYGANSYSNYGIYGSYTPYTMQGYGAEVNMGLGGYGSNILQPYGVSGLGNLENLPIEQFVPMNFTNNSSDILYGMLTNSSSPLTRLGGFPGDIYGQPIAIDEETFKKLMGQPSVPQAEVSNTEASSGNSAVTTLIPEAETVPVVTTTKSSFLFG